MISIKLLLKIYNNMRPVARIKPLLPILRDNIEHFLSHTTSDLNPKDIDWNIVEEHWKLNHDFRFVQLLSWLYPNNFFSSFNTEELDYVINELKVDPVHVLLWGVNFDKDGRKLPETEYRMIKDLETDHIQAILYGEFTKDRLYIEAFNRILIDRKINNIIL